MGRTITQNEGLRYLDPKMLSGLDNLEMVAKFIVEGTVIGLHRSPYHGFSAEFSSYRKYAEGDELKFVDWRVFARTERFYIKLFEETTNLNCYLVLDASKSMDMSDDGGISKLEYAKYLCAGLAYLMLRQGDAVSLATFNSQSYRFMQPSSRILRLNEILAQLANLTPEAETALGKTFSTLGEQIHGRSLIIIVSDFMTPLEEIRQGLQYFRYRNHEVILFQVLCRSETAFPFDSQTCFQDMENGREVLTEPAQIRDTYLQLLAEHEDRITRQCTDLNIDYVRLSTDENLASAIITYLGRRASAL